MAVGDSIGWSVNAGGDNVTIRPASGDTWMLTDFGCDDNSGGITWEGAGGSANLYDQPVQAKDLYSYSAQVKMWRMWAMAPLGWIVSNATYIKFNSSTNNHVYWHGFKTAD